MNKLVVVGILGVLALFIGCTRIENSTSDSIITERVTENYSGTFASVGVGPEISKERDAGDNVLVLRSRVKDVMHHVFVPEEQYKKFFKSEEQYLPGNKIELEASVYELPGNLGHRFFEVKEVQSMKLLSYPDIEEIGNILTSYGSCKEDSDCEMIGGICPLDCYIGINSKFKKISTYILGNYFSRNGDKICSLSCPYAEKSICRFNSCMVSYGNDEEMPYYEGANEEKMALVCPQDISECNPEGPVCGVYGDEYESACEACAAGEEMYVTGGC